jgi:hypothetical protein
LRFLLACAAISALTLFGCSQSPSASFAPGGSSSASNARALAPHDRIVFHRTGTLQSFIVPSGVTHVTIDAGGAQGTSPRTAGGVGGNGAFVTGTFAVVAGELLYVEVGLHGGGVGGAGSELRGGDGGSYSGVLHMRHDGSAQILIVAGGGGGAGGGYGGHAASGSGGAGGLDGEQGSCSAGHLADCGQGYGKGGTRTSGGAGGYGDFGGGRGLPGVFGVGGAGGPGAPTLGYGGGGGGAGYHGGGGGGGSARSFDHPRQQSGSGGGGGSSFVNPEAANVRFVSGGHAGPGEITIVW